MLRRLAPLVSVIAVLSLVAGCSSSEANAVDSGAPITDSGSPADGSSGADADAAATDTGTTPIDSGTIDSSPPVDSAVDSGADSGTDSGADSALVDSGSLPGDTGASCNDLAFGQPASIYITVSASSLGTLTGGAIVDGVYDLVAVETSSTLPASYTMQATWRFTGGTLDQLDQLKTTTLGPLVHRTGSIAVAGATLTRTYTCGSTDSTPAALNYDSKLVSGAQTVRVQSGALRLTFEKRP
jgi:hypothetical protein